MLFAIEISDAVWLAVIAVVAMAVKEYFDRGRSREAVAKVETVKTTLATATKNQTEKMDGLAQVANDTHILVNRRMGIQLRLAAVSLRRIAAMTVGTDSHADDVAAANEAETLLREHLEQQAKVDAPQQITVTLGGVSPEAVKDIKTGLAPDVDAQRKKT